MRIGICTPWRRRDVAYAAIQLADLFSRWGHHVALFTSIPQPARVSHYWDGKIRTAGRMKFTSWAVDLDTIIWTTCPHVGQPAWAEKAGKQTVLLGDPGDGALIEETYPAFHKILAPSSHAVRVLTAARLKSVVACPWSPVLPVTTPTGTEVVTGLRLYVPPIDRSRSTSPDAAMTVIGSVLAARPAVVATVSLSGRDRSASQRLRRLARTSGGRLTLLGGEDYDRQLLRYGEHDLTLLTATSEVFGIAALCSLHMSTPVVGYLTQPLTEIVGDRSGVLVPRAGQPEDCIRLARKLMRVLDSPSALFRYRTGCPTGLMRRREAFELVLSGIAARPTIPQLSRKAGDAGV
jgi:hypothetical protein